MSVVNEVQNTKPYWTNAILLSPLLCIYLFLTDLLLLFSMTGKQVHEAILGLFFFCYTDSLWTRICKLSVSTEKACVFRQLTLVKCRSTLVGLDLKSFQGIGCTAILASNLAKVNYSALQFSEPDLRSVPSGKKTAEKKKRERTDQKSYKHMQRSTKHFISLRFPFRNTTQKSMCRQNTMKWIINSLCIMNKLRPSWAQSRVEMEEMSP